MSVNLSTALLRSFVAIVDCGSLLNASHQVMLSQSTLSSQVKNLESQLRQPLFQRDGRRLVLTAAGQSLLSYARKILALHDEAVSAISSNALSGPIRIGIVQDFSDAFLRGLLSDFSDQFPETQIYVKVARTVQLKKLVAEGELDIVIGMGDVAEEAVVAAQPMCWFGRQTALKNNVLSLALLEAPCRFRDAALSALNASGRDYRIAIEAPNLSTLKAAVDAGLGITCRTALFAEADQVLKAKSLPALPDIGFVLHSILTLSPAAGHFRSAAADALTKL
ncbi:LysR substrate-binding domain-containing protein [Sphingomonas abietis]|uniref:LysR substrate-binding domain-containing protein n=1 Tax=Sphingomonas abietis TaxID=3012344 RepID=A0ABY7NJ62_9SPHN|nr:LysR substrate-binding domain-containing protein [Sphingomonas abietis]WBO21363.1 LysR substrate-binding domain-containing protein [Sphingomonas abietis]